MNVPHCVADAQPGSQPDVPIHGFYLASVGAARRLPYSLGRMPIGEANVNRPNS